LAWAHRFQGYRAPVDAARIERWLAQFPSEHRWVGEGLLDAVEFVPRERLAHSVGFLLRAYGLAADDSGVMVETGARGEVRVELRREGIELPWRRMDVALHEDTWRTLIVADDVCLTGTRHIGLLDGIWGGLNDVAKGRLQRHGLVLVFAMATTAGLERVGRWLERRSIPQRAVVGRERRLLSDLGWSEWDSGHLLDEGGALAQPAVHLIEPLFSPHNPVWGGDHLAARALCADMGRALLEPMADAKGWSEARLTGSVLGFSGLQGRLVLGHRVPRSTLPVYWCAGRWRSRPWVPLFPDDAAG
jgi:hypothetical protein